MSIVWSESDTRVASHNVIQCKHIEETINNLSIYFKTCKTLFDVRHHLCDSVFTYMYNFRLCMYTRPQANIISINYNAIITKHISSDFRSNNN